MRKLGLQAKSVVFACTVKYLTSVLYHFVNAFYRLRKRLPVHNNFLAALAEHTVVQLGQGGKLHIVADEVL